MANLQQSHLRAVAQPLAQHPNAPGVFAGMPHAEQLVSSRPTTTLIEITKTPTTTDNLPAATLETRQHDDLETKGNGLRRLNPNLYTDDELIGNSPERYFNARNDLKRPRDWRPTHHRPRPSPKSETDKWLERNEQKIMNKMATISARMIQSRNEYLAQSGVNGRKTIGVPKLGQSDPEKFHLIGPRGLHDELENVSKGTDAFVQNIPSPSGETWDWTEEEKKSIAEMAFEMVMRDELDLMNGQTGVLPVKWDQPVENPRPEAPPSADQKHQSQPAKAPKPVKTSKARKPKPTQTQTPQPTREQHPQKLQPEQSRPQKPRPEEPQVNEQLWPPPRSWQQSWPIKERERVEESQQFDPHKPVGPVEQPQEVEQSQQVDPHKPVRPMSQPLEQHLEIERPLQVEQSQQVEQPQQVKQPQEVQQPGQVEQPEQVDPHRPVEPVELPPYDFIEQPKPENPQAKPQQTFEDLYQVENMPTETTLLAQEIQPIQTSEPVEEESQPAEESQSVEETQSTKRPLSPQPTRGSLETEFPDSNGGQPPRSNSILALVAALVFLLVIRP